MSHICKSLLEQEKTYNIYQINSIIILLFLNTFKKRQWKSKDNYFKILSWKVLPKAVLGKILSKHLNSYFQVIKKNIFEFSFSHNT